jgi:peptide/nickel transport system permease protein
MAGATQTTESRVGAGRLSRASSRNPAAAEFQRRGPRRQGLRRFTHSSSAMFGGLLVLVVLGSVLGADVLAPSDPTGMRLAQRLQPPSAQAWLGTDEFGRDVGSRVLHGGRISLLVGLMVVTISGIGGLALGLSSGYLGGWLDFLLLRLMDILLAIPGLLLALSVSAILGPGLINVMLAVGLSSIPVSTRLIRATALSIRQQPYIEAARVVGGSPGSIMLRHVLPNIAGPFVVLSSLQIPAAILAAASLSFVGLGAQPPTPEWGAMLSVGRDFLQQQWWIASFPGLAIMISVLGFNLLGDGVRDALDTRLGAD